MIYCPYNDREIPRDQANSEHTISLTLGGVDGFELPVDAEANAHWGSALDGQFANEFVTSLHRTRFDARGYRGEEPKAIIKHARYGQDDRPAQVSLHSERGIKVRDSQDRQYKERVPKFKISTTLNINLPQRLTAKVAVAAGYFAYGAQFRLHVVHRQLRDLIHIDLADLDLNRDLSEQGLNCPALRVDHCYRETDNVDLRVIREFCSRRQGSVVILMPGYDCFTVALGILGGFVAMVSVPANTESFPRYGVFDMGPVLAIEDKKLKRYPWRCGHELLLQDIGPELKAT